MTISRSSRVNPGQKLADAATAEHRDRDLRGVRLVAAGFNQRFQFLRLHGFRGHYRPGYPDP